MKLTVIVPIYNAEKYLPTCLDSLVSCPLSDMECLLINDGSTDSSLHICNEYTGRDSRFRVIDKANEGVSIARNIGISHATGKYIMFLDADDYIDTNKWNKIVDAIALELDFIAFSYFTLYENKSVKEELFDIQSLSTNDTDSIRKILLGSSALNTCWGKLFKTELVLNNHISFPKGLRTGEDAIFVLDFLKMANHLLLINESILYYRQHGESVMHKLDIHSKISDFQQLYNYRRKMSDLWNNEELKAVMYREFLSVITNLLLIYSYKRKYSECNKVFKQLLNNEMIQNILTHVKPTYLKSHYKRLEFQLLNLNNSTILSSYFKFKSLFLR